MNKGKKGRSSSHTTATVTQDLHVYLRVGSVELKAREQLELVER